GTVLRPEAAAPRPKHRTGPSSRRRPESHGAPLARNEGRLRPLRLRPARRRRERPVRRRPQAAMSRPLAVFDIDGTLVDSRASIHRAASEAARDMRLAEPSYDRVRMIVGLSLPQAMQMLEPQLTAAELADYVAGFQRSFRRMYEAGHDEPLYPGVMYH